MYDYAFRTFGIQEFIQSCHVFDSCTYTIPYIIHYDHVSSIKLCHVEEEYKDCVRLYKPVASIRVNCFISYYCSMPYL